MLGKLLRTKSIGLFLSALCVITMTSSPINLERSITGTQESSRMKFYLTRTQKNKTATLGAISLWKDGTPLLLTLEPPDRKIKPRTIPCGTYDVIKIVDRQSGQVRLRLLAVRGFEGIYIEVGNSPTETRGCILVGLRTEGNELKESRKAYNLLLSHLIGVDRISIEISDKTA